MRRALLVLTWGLCAAGWRYDGTAGAPSARPPSADARAVWKAPLSGAGLSSPIVVGDLVLATQEPTTLVALNLADGDVRWRASHDVVDAVPPAQAAELREALAGLPAAEARWRAAEQRQAKLAREARRGGVVSEADAHAAAAEVAAAQDAVLRVRAIKTPAARDMLGWSAPTPLAEGDAIYAAFANGVVARHALDGAVVWSRWLGPPPTQLWGYDGRPSASPLLVDGVLVVGHDRLVGLDAATGAVRWEGPAYPHYGTSAVARVGDRALIVTPGGEVVDARTGAVLTTGLGHVWYDGPHAEGAVVYMVGSSEPIPGRIEMRLSAAAWRLEAAGDGVTAAPLWRAPLGVEDRIYATPAPAGDALVALTRTGALLTIDKATGATAVRAQVMEGGDEVWASPVVAGGSLWVSSFNGHLVQVALDGSWRVTGDRPLEPTTATPLFVDDSLVWRGRSSLVRYADRAAR